MLYPLRMHSWDITPKEAVALQRELATQVEREDRLGLVSRVAGVDVSYHAATDRLAAAAVVLDAATLQVMDVQIVYGRPGFPYVPGLFSFREMPPVLAALEKLSIVPDLIVCDGHGIAHPRRFGLACHLGVWTGLPTIGCAKTRLTGTYEMPAEARGNWAPLMDKGEEIGAVLRTRDGVAPVFVSGGHRISLETACAWVLRLAPRYRLPETTRIADRLVGEALRDGADRPIS
ncbi:deoxyribonuclease V [Hyphomonas sp. WL0036]|uniref:deoxyribonuclease V n=1 Tax=Hyphomonas sediminis TaxID=2866160 RepID=UPI001C7EBC8B|nr:deoxyribonuclease V [Hyphomonas sediminis]MBY9067041.1 deoxyribonuclease V [Hyphomonas sediminis]